MLMRKIIFFIVSLFCVLSVVSCTTCPSGASKVLAENGVIHRFFDTSPISPSGRYVALFRLPYENKTPIPADAGDVIVIDLQTNREVYSTKTRGWETQMGANVQWGATDDELFYNDVDVKTWDVFAVKLNFKTGEKKRLNGSVFMVSPDGKKLSSYNLKKSRFAQVGYGAVVPNEFVKRNIGVVDDDGIYITDVAKNDCKMIASIRDIFERSVPSIKIENPENYEIYCFQTKWNPQGTRLLTTIQWAPFNEPKKRQRAVITMKPDGTDIRTAVTPKQWAKGGHHINWCSDGEYMSMNLNIDDDKTLELITVKYDGTDLKQVYPVGSGHPSYHPKGISYIITDAYAGKMNMADGTSPLRLINTKTQTEEIVFKTALPPYDNAEFRVDAHPVWVNGGNAIVFNDTINGKRCVRILDISDKLKK